MRNDQYSFPWFSLGKSGEKRRSGRRNVIPCLWANRRKGRAQKKVPRTSEDLLFLLKKLQKTYFFFLAAFFLGAAFFFAAFFLVAILLEFNVSKNGLTIVKITIILNYPNFFSKKFLTGRKKAYASAAMIETNVLLFFPFLNSTTPSLNANKE
jgi:hypothetical protein